MASLLGACASDGLSNKLPPLAVTITQTCESQAQQVPHAAVVRGKTDARVAYERERLQLDRANENLATTRECQEAQRKHFATAR